MRTEPAIILVVDDEPVILVVLQRILSQFGYSVLAASSSADALRHADEYQGHIDLLLTDLRMPGMDGWTLAQEMLKTTPQLKVVLMTGFHETSGDGTIQIIQKPFSVEDVLDAISAALEPDYIGVGLGT